MKTIASKRTAYFSFPKTNAFWMPLLGTLVEYYDYALYGFTAVLISQLYFPAVDPTASLLKTYVVFALGSIAKPIGSLIFGWIGDHMGRKIALQWSMLGIFIPTTLIGLLPTYQEWGISATIILIFCRLFQGVFLSGETEGARIYLYESFLKDRPTLINCIVGISCYLGIFLASYAVSFVPLSAETNTWRIPFLIGGALGGIIFVIRRFLNESTDYLAYQRQSKHSKTSSKISKKAFLGTIFLCGGVGGLYQLFFVFFGSYLSNVMGFFTSIQIQAFTPIMLLTHIISLLGAAWLADYFSPKKVISWGLILTIPLICLLGYQLFCNCVRLELFLAISVSYAMMTTPGFNLIIASVGVGKRYRFVSLGHALGSVLFSGCAPAVSLFLWQQTHFSFAPVIHALALCLCVQGGVTLLCRPHEKDG